MIRELGLPREALVNLIVRDGAAVPPRGSTEIQAGDELHVIARREAIPAVIALTERWATGPLGEPAPPPLPLRAAPQVFTVRRRTAEDGDPAQPGCDRGRPRRRAPARPPRRDRLARRPGRRPLRGAGRGPGRGRRPSPHGGMGRAAREAPGPEPARSARGGKRSQARSTRRCREPAGRKWWARLRRAADGDADG